MKQKTKDLASLLLCLAMVISLTACGGNDSTNIENIVSSAPVTESASDSEDAAFTVSYDNEEIYFSALSEFYDLYQQALEADTISMRHTLMAMAEAMFLESGVGIPIYTAGGSYKMSRLAYRTGGYASWMGDMVNYDQMVVTNEIILKEDYEYLRDLWNELTGTGTYTESAKAYLEEQGYTFTDTYTDTFDRVGTTWDFLSSGDIHDVDSFIDHLYKYNSEGQLEPHLATSYEVSEDGLTYTFYLREGVIWTDSQGRKVADLVADDWVAAAQHLADTGANSIENLNGLIEGMAEYLSGETTDFSTVGIKALEDYTLQYTLTEECPYFMTMLTDTAFLPMSRTYYESQGGVFGLAAYDGASVSSSYVYGIDQDHIAYCGPYLCTNVTDNNSISYVANPDYWNAENVVIQTVELIYDDGSDVTREYNDFLNGVGSTLVLDTAQLEMAKEDGNFDTYVTVADNAMNIFMLWCNLYRQTYANVADGAVASTKTDEQKEVSVAAFQNQHFRLWPIPSTGPSTSPRAWAKTSSMYASETPIRRALSSPWRRRQQWRSAGRASPSRRGPTTLRSSRPSWMPTAIPSRSGTRRACPATVSTAGTIPRRPRRSWPSPSWESRAAASRYLPRPLPGCWTTTALSTGATSCFLTMSWPIPSSRWTARRPG